jgi:hypothetical protein
LETLQTELKTTYPVLDVQIVGVNRFGLESANAQFTAGKSLPWLQDVDLDSDGASDAWAAWEVGHLDLTVLDGSNELAGRLNLGAFSLATPENYAAFREALVDIAMTSQKPWRNAEDPLDVNASGAVTPLDVLLIVNRLNSLGSQTLPPPVVAQSPPPYYDTNGDGVSSALDALLVINFLNASSPAAVGEGEGAALPSQRSAEDARPALPWRGWISAGGSSSDHSEDSTMLSHRVSAAGRDAEPSGDAARSAQIDRVFRAPSTDWLRSRWSSLHTDTELEMRNITKVVPSPISSDWLCPGRIPGAA